ncbi:hypothetical protein D3C87_1744890 [compost metagenome]
MDCSRSAAGMKVGTNMAVRMMPSLPIFCLRAVESSLTGTSFSGSVTGSVIFCSASLMWMKPTMLSRPSS